MSELPNISPNYQEPQKSNNGRNWLLIIAGLLFFCLCIVPICGIILLALLGPAIGNVFSNIVDDLITPTPGGFILIGLMFSGFKFRKNP